jgi:hypothetical protein
MKTDRLLILTGGQYHDFDLGTRFLKHLLISSGWFDVAVTEDRHALLSLGDFDGVVIYAHGGVLSAKEEQALVDFVAAGHGLVGVHSANASFYPNLRYRAMLGSRFIEHAPQLHQFQVRVSNPQHPLAAGLHDFRVVCEFYRSACDAGLDVFLTGEWEGQTIPLAYTKAHGKGRVLYIALGHDMRALGNPHVSDLIVRGARWATRSAVAAL